MRDNYIEDGEETAERSARSRVHGVNKQESNMSPSLHQPTAATFMVGSVFGVVEVVCAVSLLVGISPPIRSIADFGGVNSLSGFIHAVKTEVGV